MGDVVGDIVYWMKTSGDMTGSQVRDSQVILGKNGYPTRLVGDGEGGWEYHSQRPVSDAVIQELRKIGVELRR